jgi:hypothetical protein
MIATRLKTARRPGDCLFAPPVLLAGLCIAVALVRWVTEWIAVTWFVQVHTQSGSAYTQKRSRCPSQMGLGRGRQDCY